jgi:hypothetical protein
MSYSALYARNCRSGSVEACRISRRGLMKGLAKSGKPTTHVGDDFVGVGSGDARFNDASSGHTLPRSDLRSFLPYLRPLRE